MRKLSVILLVLMCTASIADTEVADLVAADQEELAKSEAHAAAAREALQTLFEGIESEPQATAEGGKVISHPRRAEVVREHEPSVGRIPAGTMSAAAERAFDQLRDNLLATPDVAVMRAELESYVDDYPLHREARLTLARLHILDDASSAALVTLAPLLKPLAEREHPDWQPWFWAGTAYLTIGDHAQARRMLDTAVAKNSAVADIWVQLAVLEQELDNHVGALQYIAVAEQIDAEAAAVHLNRAYSLERLGRLEDAMRAYQRFLISTPHGAASLRPTVMRRIADIASAVEAQQSEKRS